ncbi:MAG: helix-turn-helix domain-containing protein [Alphaproteobacteria bacterium]|nr:helix-turn-helix domain-containing protein [Alphaproteobacteria bacterium]
MTKDPSKDNRIEALYAALTDLRDAAETRAFLFDLCTPQEIVAMAERWEIARLLYAGKRSYREIAAQTGASTATVSRVARFLKSGADGYRMMLDRSSGETPAQREKKQ